MTEKELKYVLVLLTNKIHELTREHGSKGRTSDVNLMSDKEKWKAISIEKSIRLLKEFGTLEIDTEGFMEKENSKMIDLIKKFN